jgi:hypothetical protein
MRRPVILFFLALIYCLSVISQTRNSLVIRLGDGSDKTILLSTIKKITFSVSSIILNKTDSTTAPYAISDVKKMSFGFYSAVDEVFLDTNGVLLYPNPATDFLIIKNVPNSELNVTVFGIDGTIIKSEKLSSISYKIDISDLKKGIYLLKVDNTILKFMKQ